MESKTLTFKIFLFIIVCAGKLKAEDVPEKLINSVKFLPAIPSADDGDDRSTLIQQVQANEKLVLELLGQFRIQQQQIQVLEKRDKDRQQQIQVLEARDKNQQVQINQLRKHVETEQRQSSVLERKIQELQQVNSYDVKTNVPHHDQEAHHLEENVSGTKQRIRRAENETPVAFLATISDHTIPHAGDHQVIVFDNTITNVGNAYNEHLGSFVAPVSGIYVFSTTLFSPASVSFHADLVRNGQTITKMYLSGAEVGGYDTASQTVVLLLQKGDDVCIQHRDTDRTVNGYHYSLFSGFLLQQNYTASVIVG